MRALPITVDQILKGTAVALCVARIALPRQLRSSGTDQATSWHYHPLGQGQYPSSASADGFWLLLTLSGGATACRFRLIVQVSLPGIGGRCCLAAIVIAVSDRRRSKRTSLGPGVVCEGPTCGFACLL